MGKKTMVRMFVLAALCVVAPALFASDECERCEQSYEEGVYTAACAQVPPDSWGAHDCEIRYRYRMGELVAWCDPGSNMCFYIEVGCPTC